MGQRREAGPSSSPSFLSLALASPSPGWTDDAADAVSDAPSPAGKLAQDAPCRRRLAVLVPALDPRVASRSRRQGKRHGPRPGHAGRQAARGRRACGAQPEEGQAAQHRRQVRLVPPPLPLDTLPSSRSTSCRIVDWPSNAVLSVETYIQLLSFDSAGYPAALAFHAVHFLLRLVAFVPSFSSLTTMFYSSASTASRYVRRPSDALGDADARLEALQRQSQRYGGVAWGWWAWSFSVLLILVSMGNLAYLATRRRNYQMVLRRVSRRARTLEPVLLQGLGADSGSFLQDPLASPNARSTTLDFSPSQRRLSLADSIRRRIKAALGKVDVEESHVYPIQELSVWTPERVLWSLRFFTCVPFVSSRSAHGQCADSASATAFTRRPSPSCTTSSRSTTASRSLSSVAWSCSWCVPLSRADPCRLFADFISRWTQTYLVVHLYSTLVSDRAALQAEVMHEYNAKFVNPRVFVAKRDACVSTSQAEMVGANDWLRAGRRHVPDESLGQEDEQVVVVRGSGRRVSRRDSSVPSVQQRSELEGTDSPVPRRSRPRPSMLG